MRYASNIRKFNGTRMADDQKSDRKPAGLPVWLKELWTFACFPVSPQRGFYFPPPANKDRAVNSIEIKDFIILWTYSQWRQDLVVIPPFSPERETCCILPVNQLSHTYLFTKWKKCNILSLFHQKYYARHQKTIFQLMENRFSFL